MVINDQCLLRHHFLDFDICKLRSVIPYVPYSNLVSTPRKGNPNKKIQHIRDSVLVEEHQRAYN